MSVFVSPYNPVQQMGCRAKNPPDMVISANAPTSNSIGYLNGTFWLQVGTGLWVLISQVGGASPSANWVILEASAGGILSVASGGTGVATLTNHGVVIGQGTSPVHITAAGTLGQPLVSGGASADPGYAVLGVVGGGTGLATATGLIYGNGTSAMAGIVPTTASGAAASPLVLNNRSGTLTFTAVSIAAGATLTLTNTNSAITSSSSQVLYSWSGATTASALSVQSVTPGTGTIAYVFTNGTGAATSTANIVITFLALN